MAVERYQQYLAIRPEDSEARYTLALVLRELGRTEAAIEQFKKSITITADNAAVHRQLGDTYTRLQRLEEAIKPYQTALALNADDAGTVINLAHASGWALRCCSKRSTARSVWPISLRVSARMI